MTLTSKQNSEEGIVSGNSVCHFLGFHGVSESTRGCEQLCKHGERSITHAMLTAWLTACLPARQAGCPVAIFHWLAGCHPSWPENVLPEKKKTMVFAQKLVLCK